MSFLIKDILGDKIIEKHPGTSQSTDSKLNSLKECKTPRSIDEAHTSRPGIRSMLDHEPVDEQRSKKRRILFTRHQTWELERAFRFQPYLSSSERELLARRIHLSPNQIKIWFQNHRYKLKKYVKDIIQQAEFQQDRQLMAEYPRRLVPRSDHCSSCIQCSQQKAPFGLFSIDRDLGHPDLGHPDLGHPDFIRQCECSLSRHHIKRINSYPSTLQFINDLRFTQAH